MLIVAGGVATERVSCHCSSSADQDERVVGCNVCHTHQISSAKGRCHSEDISQCQCRTLKHWNEGGWWPHANDLKAMFERRLSCNIAEAHTIPTDEQRRACGTSCLNTKDTKRKQKSHRTEDRCKAMILERLLLCVSTCTSRLVSGACIRSADCREKASKLPGPEVLDDPAYPLRNSPCATSRLVLVLDNPDEGMIQL